MKTRLHPDQLLPRIRRRLRIREALHRVLLDLTVGFSVLAGLAVLDIWVPVPYLVAAAVFLLVCTGWHLWSRRARRYPDMMDAAGYLDRVYGLGEEFLAHVSPAAGRSALRGAAEAHLLRGLSAEGRMPPPPGIWLQSNAWVFLPLTVFLSVLCIRPLADMVQAPPPSLFDDPPSVQTVHAIPVDPGEKGLQDLAVDFTMQDVPPADDPETPDADALAEAEDAGAEGGAGYAEGGALHAEGNGEDGALAVEFADADADPILRFRQRGVLSEREPPLRVRHRAHHYLVRLETLE